MIQSLFLNTLSDSTKNSYTATSCSVTFIACGFFTITNRIGYTKILNSDFKGERCTVLKSLGDIDYPEVFVVFLSPSMQMSGWRFRLCHGTYSFLLILLLNAL